MFKLQLFVFRALSTVGCYAAACVALSMCPVAVAQELPTVKIVLERTGPYKWTHEERIQKAGSVLFTRLLQSGDYAKILATGSLYVGTSPSFKGDLYSRDVIDASNGLARKFGENPTPQSTKWEKARNDVLHWADKIPLGKKSKRTVGDGLRISEKLFPEQNYRLRERHAINIMPRLTDRPGGSLEDDLALLRTPDGLRRYGEIIFPQLIDRGMKNPQIAEALRQAIGFDPQAINDEVIQAELDRQSDVSQSYNGTWRERLARAQSLKLVRLAQRAQQLSSERTSSEAAKISRQGGGATVAEPPKTPEQIQREIQELREDIQSAQLVLGLTTNILKNAGGDAAKVGRALDTVGNAVFKVIMTKTLTASLQTVAFPLAIISGLSDLFSLFSSGPDTLHIVLEQLQELRREVREFRHETRVSLFYIHQDVLAKCDQILDRIDAAEFALDRRISHLEQKLDRVAAAQVEQEQRLIGYQQQLLWRLSDIHKLIAFDKDYQTYTSRRSDLTGLLAKTSSEDKIREFDNYLATFGAFSCRWSANKAHAGGDYRFFDSYSPSQLPNLGIEGARQLVGLVDNPRGAWPFINDYANLAEGAGVPWPEAGALRQEPRLGKDGELLVNPDTWRLGALIFLDLSERSPELFSRKPIGASQLAKIYFQGERTRQFVDSLTRHSDGSPRRDVFDALIQTELAAIDLFEKTLIDKGKALETQVKFDFWADDPLKPRVGVIPIGPELPLENRQGSRMDPRLTPEERGFSLPGKLALDGDERTQLENTVPGAYRLAARIKWPSRGPDKVEFWLDDMRYEDVAMRQRKEYGGMPVRYHNRGTLQQSPYFYGQIDGWDVGPELDRAYRLVPEWHGKVTIVVRADYISGGNGQGRQTIYRKRLTTDEVIKIGESEWQKLNEKDPHHQDLNWNLEGRVLERQTRREGDFLFFGGGEDVKYVRVVKDNPELRREQIEKHWTELKKKMFDPATPSDDSPEAQQVQKTFEEKLHRSISDYALAQLLDLQLSAERELALGVNDIGQAIRALHGTQMAVQRFAELALPDDLNSNDVLASMVAGDQSVLNWQTIHRLLHPHGEDKPVVKGSIQADGLVQKGPSGPYIPVASEMRLRCERLRIALNEAIARRVAFDSPPRHQELDEMLAQIIWRARGLDVDLESELAKLGAKPTSRWMIRQQKANELRLNALLPEANVSP